MAYGREKSRIRSPAERDHYRAEVSHLAAKSFEILGGGLRIPFIRGRARPVERPSDRGHRESLPPEQSEAPAPAPGTDPTGDAPNRRSSFSPWMSPSTIRAFSPRPSSSTTDIRRYRSSWSARSTERIDARRPRPRCSCSTRCAMASGTTRIGAPAILMHIGRAPSRSRQRTGASRRVFCFAPRPAPRASQRASGSLTSAITSQ